MSERIDASFPVSLFSWAETARDLELALLRFGVERRALRVQWRGLHFLLSLSAEGTTDRVDGLARYLTNLVESTGGSLEVSRTKTDARAAR